MGLDIVELVMEVEEAFNIRIPDSDASNIRTVGDLVRYVKAAVHCPSGGPCLTSRMFYRTRQVLIHAGGLPRRAVRPAVRLEVLVQASQRRRVWQLFREQGLRLPELQLPPFLLWALFTLPVVAASTWAVWTNSCLAGAVSWLVFLWLFARATRSWAVHVPCGDGTLRAIIMRGVTPLASDSTATLSADEVAAKVRAIIADELGVDFHELRDEASFIDDLGCD